MLGPVLGWDHVWVLQKVLSELVSLDLESNPVSDLDEYPDALFDLIPQIQFIDDHDRCVCGGVVAAVVGTGVCARDRAEAGRQSEGVRARARGEVCACLEGQVCMRCMRCIVRRVPHGEWLPVPASNTLGRCQRHVRPRAPHCNQEW